MKQPLSPFICTLVLITSFFLPHSVRATQGGLKKPETMEEMWQIIQAQQQQIDTMKKQLEHSSTSAPPPPADEKQVKQLDRKTNILAQEVEKIRTSLMIPLETKFKSQYGLGPAASQVYQVKRGISIGGYGEGLYQAIVGDKAASKKGNTADLERAVLYVGYKFNDRILFNSEIEYEHATTGEGAEEKGEVSVEFASLDFFFNPMANARMGMVLMPVGFINLIHEPPFFFGNLRPEVEQRIIPTTWREMGIGLFGELAPGLTYTTYAVNGMNAKEFNSDGIRGGRQGGSQAKAEDIGFVGRMDYAPAELPGLTLGGSAYLGNSGQNQTFAGRKANVFTQLYEAHIQWKYRGIKFRTLGAWGHIGDAAILSAAKGETIGSQNYGWYTELGYDILPLLMPDSTQYLAPFFRYEKYDTIARAPTGFPDDPTKDRRILQVGMNYKPIPNVVIKADYRNWTSAGGDLPDDFNLGFGFIY